MNINTASAFSVIKEKRIYSDGNYLLRFTSGRLSFQFAWNIIQKWCVWKQRKSQHLMSAPRCEVWTVSYRRLSSSQLEQTWLQLLGQNHIWKFHAVSMLIMEHKHRKCVIDLKPPAAVSKWTLQKTTRWVILIRSKSKNCADNSRLMQ